MEPDEDPRANTLSERLWRVLLALGFLAYGAYSIAVDRMHFPLGRRRVLELHGESAWLMEGALVCMLLFALCQLADFFHGRGTRRHYTFIANSLAGLGVLLAIVSVILAIRQA